MNFNEDGLSLGLINIWFAQFSWADFLCTCLALPRLEYWQFLLQASLWQFNLNKLEIMQKIDLMINAFTVQFAQKSTRPG
jgi:hypothetical protein